jgi:energy-coupling factor transport system permease protein
VNIAPRYLGRGSWLARRDPRLLVLLVAAYIITVIQIWDARVMVVMLAVALIYYRSAGIRFADVRRNWIAALTLLTIVVIVNTVLTGDRLEGVEVHEYFRLPLIGTPISAESLSYAATQWIRYVGMVAVGFPLAFCVAPSDIGVTFARLGVPEKFAFGVDLTFRFIPSLAAEYQQTIDAQRIRGFDPRGGRRGPIASLKANVPLLTPLTVNAIAGAEDTIDAMDLRAFGTGRRSWLRELRFDPTDRILLLGAFAMLIAFTALGFAGITSKLYVFPFLLDLAGA